MGGPTADLSVACQAPSIIMAPPPSSFIGIPISIAALCGLCLFCVCGLSIGLTGAFSGWYTVEWDDFDITVSYGFFGSCFYNSDDSVEYKRSDCDAWVEANDDDGNTMQAISLITIMCICLAMVCVLSLCVLHAATFVASRVGVWVVIIACYCCLWI